MAQRRAGDAQHREYHTDWEQMTDEQKLDFLYGWCHKLEATLDGRRKVIYRLNAELQKAQKKRGERNLRRNSPALRAVRG